MPSFKTNLISISLALFASASAQQPSTYCPLLGPVFPPPTYLSNDPTFAAAIQEITSTLDQATSNGSLSEISLSVQIFDASYAGPLLNFAYTADNINTTLGVSTVNQDTVFRIGSVSKLWTMVLLLAEEGLWPFQEPVARFIPELREAASELLWDPRKRRNGIDYVHWGEISIGELASHLAGIARDCMHFPLFFLIVNDFLLTLDAIFLDGELDLSGMASQLEQMGFPALLPYEIPPCGNPDPCSRERM